MYMGDCERNIILIIAYKLLIFIIIIGIMYKYNWFDYSTRIIKDLARIILCGKDIYKDELSV